MRYTQGLLQRQADLSRRCNLGYVDNIAMANDIAVALDIDLFATYLIGLIRYGLHLFGISYTVLLSE